jgi:2-polyprenyl-3-methyl-5-hydroxy-6-metoxy-1,4-benzoquinol methylase
MFEKDLPGKLDNSPHSPHNIIPNLIKKEKALILDVGCNTGMVGKEIIRKKAAIVDGIDINEEALEQAEEAYRKVFQRDLSRDKVKIDEEKYDYIIFSDILEHLPRPDLALQDFKRYLKDDGSLIISLPNVARLEIRLGLLLGNFDYKPGIMSEDHLRFFTKRSAVEMIEKCGYRVVGIVPTGFGHRFQILTTLTAFQFVYISKKIL